MGYGKGGGRKGKGQGARIIRGKDKRWVRVHLDG